MPSMSSRWRPLITSTSLALALSGCGGNVVIDESSSETSTSTPPEIANALLVTKPIANGLCAYGIDQNQPGTVFLYVAGQPITCAKPELFSPDTCATVTPGQPSWEICIPIQPELGPKDYDFHSYGGYTNYVTEAPGCTSVWGVLQQGFMSIKAVDPSTVTFTLSGTDPMNPGFEMASDGAYEALRCP